jgi:hypothetical protein
MVTYSVPKEARKVFIEGIIHNPLIAPNLPPEATALANRVTFTGEEKPNVPINWRFAESIASLKAFEAVMLACLVSRRFGNQPDNITIDV